MTHSSDSPTRLLEGFFRHEYGRAVGALVRRYGAGQLERIEDSVQSSMLVALETWGRRGIPANPGAWIQTVAKNRFLDTLKHASVVHRNASAPASETRTATLEVRFASELEDDTLRMLFVCCDPSLSRRTQLALSLKIVCGLGTQEIAIAFMQEEEAIRKRIHRGRHQLRHIATEERPDSEESLEAVHQVLYALFNKGYSAGRGHALFDRSLCFDAIRLAETLAVHPRGNRPNSWALLALMRLHHARFDARADKNGMLLLLEEQDRSLWNRDEISRALADLARSASGNVFSRFHAEAGILVEHCLAPSYADTNWAEIVRLYEMHESKTHSPMHALNRAIAVSELQGANAGLALLNAMTPPSWLSRWYLWDATLGELYRRVGNNDRAEKHLAKALKSAPNDAESDRIRRRLTLCKAAKSPP